MWFVKHEEGECRTSPTRAKEEQFRQVIESTRGEAVGVRPYS
jgi:hypothetical protein